MSAWIGALAVVTGRGLLATDFFLLGFATGALGDAAWIYFGVTRKIWSLVFLDAVLLMADLLGVGRAI